MKRLSSAACAVAAASSFAAIGSGGCSALVTFEECSEDEDCPPGYRCSGQKCSAVVGKERVIVTTGIASDTTWDADHLWEIRGTVFVDAGATLTIAAGTRIEMASGAALVIDRGGTIDAVGGENNPIVFTSIRPEGQRASGDWGGLILLGSAPTSEGNDLSFTALEPLGRSSYGGSDATSSCGVVEYVRIEFGGVSKDAGREVPAFALAACGSATKVDHVQVHRARDEAIEVLGGNVSLSHIVATFAGEVGFEYKKGWVGVAQFLMVHQGEDGEFGIIGEEGFIEGTQQPGTHARIANFTVLAEPVSPGQVGIFIQEGARGELANGLVGGQTFHALNIGSEVGEPLEDTVAQIESGELSLRSTVFFRPTDAGELFPSVDEEAGDADDDAGFDEAAHFQVASFANVFDKDPQVSVASTATQWVPGNSAMREGAANLTSPFAPGTSYYGAFKVGVTPWTEGWTASPEN